MLKHEIFNDDDNKKSQLIGQYLRHIHSSQEIITISRIDTTRSLLLIKSVASNVEIICHIQFCSFHLVVFLWNCQPDRIQHITNFEILYKVPSLFRTQRLSPSLGDQHKGDNGY